ncbi:hypothetical protein KR084_000817, partial [Drosophila pseudotakahashii]
RYFITILSFEGCVVRVCNELSQNMSSLNKMFKYHLLEVS